MDGLGDLASAVRLLSFHAVQAQRRPPPSHSACPLPRHELGVRQRRNQKCISAHGITETKADQVLQVID